MRNRLVLFVAMTCLLPATIASAAFTSVSLSSIADGQLYQNIMQQCAVYDPPPTGSANLGGVPFTIPADGANCWAPGYLSGPPSGTISANLPVGIYGVTDAYSLMNTLWGAPGTYTRVEFFGNNGAYYSKELCTDIDIRAWLDNSYNPYQINGTSTTQVWSGTAYRWGVMQACLDMQHYTLPETFATQTLDHITITDWGATAFQRTFLAGFTVDAESVPLPAALPAGLGALAGLAGLRTWRRSR